MAPNIPAAGTIRLGILRRVPSAAFCLQAAACLVVAWSLWPGSLTNADPPPVAPPRVTPKPDAAAPVAGAAVAGMPTLAAAPTLEGALSSIDVIVSRNDTLDRIFRRLKLSLGDLASMRSLPNVRASLDSLRPGESLHLTHKDGALFGLERRLNESQTLKVSRDGDNLKADVLQNALQLHPRTV